MSTCIGRIALVALALVLLPLCGCGAGVAATGLTVESSRPAGGELTARVASIDVAPRLRYTCDAEPGYSVVTERGDAAAGGWSVRKLRLNDGATQPTLMAEMSFRLEDGAVVMDKTREEADEVVTEFSPALVAMPVVLRAGAGETQSFKMIVRPGRDLSRIQTQGPATHEIRYEADETVRVPAGRFECRKVVAVLRATLGQAKVENTTESWHAPGVGIVAERHNERVTVLGLPFRSKDRTWALAEIRTR